MDELKLETFAPWTSRFGAAATSARGRSRVGPGSVQCRRSSTHLLFCMSWSWFGNPCQDSNVLQLTPVSSTCTLGGWAWRWMTEGRWRCGSSPILAEWLAGWFSCFSSVVLEL